MFQMKSFFFHIQYHAHFDEQLIIVGDCAQFGNWDINKGIILEWTQGDFWTKKFDFHSEVNENVKKIEYKYVLCCKKNDCFVPVRWEAGVNRQINYSANLSFNDIWNYRKIILRLRNNLPTTGKNVFLMSFVNNQQKMKKMNLVKKASSIFSFWQAKIYVDFSQSYYKYCYILYDKTTKKIYWDREQIRRVNVNEILYQNNDVQKSPLSVKPKNNSFKILDRDFNQRFSFNHINENILIGPYPQNEEEIEILRKNEVCAVLNLQTKADMQARGINCEELNNIYEQKNIFFKNYQICDETADLADKLLGAAHLLHELVKKFEKVYIHCSAGVFRAPSTVAAYLYIYENYSLNMALDTLKRRRPISHPSKKCLTKALISQLDQHKLISYI